MRKLAIFVFALIILGIETQPVAAFSNWGIYRGMTASAPLKESDVRDFSKLGGNLLRIDCHKIPLLEMSPPYQVNNASLEALDNIVGWAKKYHVKIIIDPHYVPGMQSRFTTSSSDELWRRKDLQDALVGLWGILAKRYSGMSETIVGYDLLNEPSMPGISNVLRGAASWNNISARIIDKIRSIDSQMPIILEPAIGTDSVGRYYNRLQAISLLKTEGDSKTVVSPHMYLPVRFTHQGIFPGFSSGILYPGVVSGKFWDKDRLRTVLQPIRDLQVRTGVPIYIGEFSAAMDSGESGDRYLADLIGIFEEYGWSWSYHTWRGAAVWDAEASDAKVTSGDAQPTRSRLKILEDAFQKNN